MAQIMLKDPLKMSYKSWLTRPLKIFHGPKNEIFGPVQSSTGIKGATNKRLPLNTPQMTLKHLSWAYYKNISYFLAFLGSFLGPFGAGFGPVFGSKLEVVAD